MLLIKHR